MGLYRKYDYSIGYSGHLIDEYDFYTVYFNKLFKNLFNKNLRIFEDRRKNKSSIKLCTQSKAIFTFLRNCIGITPYTKQNLSIPPLIEHSEYIPYFIRGLADSDFSLTFKRRKLSGHSYPVITFCSSNSILVLQINKILDRFGFKTYILLNFTKMRYEKRHISNQIDINGRDQLEHWFKTIGFNSEKHLTKYRIWKNMGFALRILHYQKERRFLIVNWI